ncbi:hypothetical protein [Streptomyces sp. NPDC088762]|uniref:hypothetical protein n=1 Tax=Streptomyces sp. NPDC088762 TaxID=3365891 RepID=UPI00382C7C6F
MSRTWKAAAIVLALAGMGSTPLVWVLDGSDAGQLTGASIQAAVGVAALIWALLQPSAHGTGRTGRVSGTEDTALRTGSADASGGASAVSGIRRRPGQGDSGSAKAEDTGNTTATGDNSRAVSGIDYT